jgi:hypothetical protein
MQLSNYYYVCNHPGASFPRICKKVKTDLPTQLPNPIGKLTRLNKQEKYLLYPERFAVNSTVVRSI